MADKKHNILIVDDIEDNRRIVEGILKMNGYKTVSVSDGVSALRMIKKESFDLILLDIMMADMSGLEVCRYLRIDPENANIPVIFLTANSDRDTITKAYKVGGSDYIKKPFYKEELLARVETRLNLRDYEKNLEETVIKRTQEIHETQVQLMHILGSVAEGHSEETQYHVKRVAAFSYKLAVLYGLDEQEANLLKDASFLHDIGKIAIPDSILHKQGVLTNSEYKKMKQHAALGADMLKHSHLPLFKAAKIVAEEHHEKWDGTGYPKGLKGEQIHIYGRIVAIADVFDALSFKRAYKDKWENSEVLSYMKDMSGKHFDPKLIELFFDNIDDFLKIYNLHIQKIELDKKYNVRTRKSIMDWLLQRR